MAARLAAQTSPYLLQHVDNPVDWWPWCDEAFEAARRLDRPVLVSIGYSSCHWCHVMAHESFEDPAIAERMNASFINIKVDREERPDVDALYMAALQAMTGRGGWPLNAFATPDGRPFYAGTYWPPVPRHGLPSWSDVVGSIADAWATRRADVESHGSGLVEALAGRTGLGGAAHGDRDDFDGASLLAPAAQALMAEIDPTAGGFGGAPKFPQTAALSFLLAWHVRAADEPSRAAVVAALDAMLAGGLVDQLDGGFHRYCVDRTWTVPHYEKMLYDNAQLLGLLTDAARRTDAPRLVRAAQRTADFLLSTLQSVDGVFYAALDADTAAGEGVYYTWTPAELEAVLGGDLGALAAAWYGVAPNGNTDDARSVLTERRQPGSLADRFGLAESAVTERIDAARARLLAARGERVAPALDTKVITGWNALAIRSLARAGAAFGRRDWVDAAGRAALFIEERVRVDTPAGPRLAHHWAGGRAGVPAFADDVATFALACVQLYEATFDPCWAERARAHASVLVADFVDAESGAFFQTAAYHPPLVVRSLDVHDHATPSGNAAAALALLHVGALFGDPDLERHAQRALAAVAAAVRSTPAAFGDTLLAIDALAAGVRTVTLSAGNDDDALVRAVRRRHHPATVVRLGPHADLWEAGGSVLAAEASAGQPRGGATAPTAEVCARGTCHLPVATALELQALLAETEGLTR